MGILSSIFTGFLTILIAVVLVILLRVAFAYYSMGFYRKQGIRSYFDPMFGLIGVALRKQRPGVRRFDEYLVEELKDDYKRGAIVHTGVASGKPAVALLTAEYFKEYIAQEDKFYRKNQVPTADGILGFLDKHGPAALKERHLFQEIFHYDKIKSLVPRILDEIEDGLTRFVETNKLTKESFIKVDISQVFKDIMFKIGLVLIYGEKKLLEDSIEVRIAKNVGDIVEDGIKLTLNPLLTLFPGVFNAFPFLSSKLTKLLKDIETQKQLIAKYIEQRKSSSHLGDSAFDRIITHNRNCREDGRTEDIMDVHAIMGTLNLLMFAAFDTSQNMTILNLCLMAERPDIREKVAKIAEEIYDSRGNTTADIVDAHEDLSMYFKEAMRLESSTAAMFRRVAHKDVTIKDIIVRKGDEVTVMFAPFVMDPKYFSNPSTFQFDRFSKENEKKYGYPKFQVPVFGIGKRACLGRSLAELNVKLLLTSFCKRFEFTKPADVNYYSTIRAIKIPVYPFLEAKLK